jgi:hypothetical protein
MASTDAGQVALASNGGKREKVDPVTTLQEGIGELATAFCAILVVLVPFLCR